MLLLTQAIITLLTTEYEASLFLFYHFFNILISNPYFLLFILFVPLTPFPPFLLFLSLPSY
jgi:hypothetical protein